jgi:hypothetical protein
MDPIDDDWRSAARAMWYDLLDNKVFRIVAFIAGSALIWWLRSR